MLGECHSGEGAVDDARLPPPQTRAGGDAWHGTEAAGLRAAGSCQPTDRLLTVAARRPGAPGGQATRTRAA